MNKDEHEVYQLNITPSPIISHNFYHPIKLNFIIKKRNYEILGVNIIEDNGQKTRMKIILDGKKYVTSDVMIKESIRKVLREERKPPNYIKRRYTCMDEYITKLESGEETIPIRMGRFDWTHYQIIVTAFIINNCKYGNGYYDPIIHSNIMDIFGDRLYQWYYKDNIKL